MKQQRAGAPEQARSTGPADLGLGRLTRLHLLRLNEPLLRRTGRAEVGGNLRAATLEKEVSELQRDFVRPGADLGCL